jgi:hypothetical protein
MTKRRFKNKVRKKAKNKRDEFPGAIFVTYTEIKESKGKDDSIVAGKTLNSLELLPGDKEYIASYVLAGVKRVQCVIEPIEKKVPTKRKKK